jgi:hypothetical protein
MIALLSITAYFMNENKKLTGKLNSLSEKVEEQDEKLQKHDKVLFDILRQMESSKVQNVVMTPSPSPGISYKPICITTSSGNQICTPSYGLEKVEEEDEEEEEEEEAQEEGYESNMNVILISPPVVSLPPPPVPSKVEEIIEEEEEVLPPPQPQPSSSDKKKRKRHNKKKTQTSSVTDIDKELENELNELFREEILSSH